MVQTVPKNQSSDEIVSAVAGQGEAGPRTLTELVHNASEEFTDRWAIAAGQQLLKSLVEDARSLPEFEALIVLALAKPRLPQKLSFSLSQEGRRLAVLYEHGGDRPRSLALLEVLNTRLPDDRHVERDLAAMLRKTGNGGRLVERYLGRAEDAVRGGEPMDAVPWLQEVLLVDRSRRDVARMIRDLRFQEAERLQRRKMLWKRALITLLVLASLGLAGWREWDLNARFRAIPQADETMLSSLNGRIAALDDLVNSNPLWLGKLPVSRERTRLKSVISTVNKKVEERARMEAEKLDLSLAEADGARYRGRIAVERKDLSTAHAEFTRALELGPEDWEHRERLERDVAALRELLEEAPQ